MIETKKGLKTEAAVGVPRLVGEVRCAYHFVVSSSLLWFLCVIISSTSRVCQHDCSMCAGALEKKVKMRIMCHLLWGCRELRELQESETHSQVNMQ